MSRSPTKQQSNFIAALVKPNTPMLKLIACAGGGKTSTLEMGARAYEVPSMYLAFNKVTANEAQERFPRHVQCRTTHSLAYQTYGRQMADKLARPKGGYVNVAGTGSEIARMYGLESFEPKQGEALTSTFVGQLVKATVTRFEQSADAELDIKHVPKNELQEKGLNIPTVVRISEYILKNARLLWADRINMNSRVLASHDTYLKLYQLSKPVIGGIQVLYVDEAQDTTPCVMDIVMNQATAGTKIILVGDPRQAIYGWRGAVNAMEMFDAPSMPLSKSFRYGPAIAKIATTVLEGAMKVEGLESINSVVGLENVVDRTKPYTRLFRTNAALLMAAIEEIGKGTEVALEIDVKDFVRMLQSAQALFEGRIKDVKHEEVIPYASWADMVTESKNSPGLGRIVKVVAEYLAPEWIRILENFVNSRNPHVTFTTAHKSKGREFLQVIIENDFKSCYNDDGEFVGLSTEEQNLLYVAVTRAIERLEYNMTVYEYVTRERAVENTYKAELRKVIRELDKDMAF